MRLSKSKYVSGLECPKILWMDLNMPEQKAEQDDTRMKIGLEVGDLAMGYFGYYVEVGFNRANMGEMVSKTKQLIEADTAIIAEATFAVDNNFCMVDILRKTLDGYEIIEAKSSVGSPGDTASEVEVQYLNDLAYQYYVVKSAGLTISKARLIQLNREYIRNGELDIKELFALADCTDAVINMQSEIPGNIKYIRSIATQSAEPDLQIGSRCKNCAYRTWCFRHLPENNVFDIGWRMWGSKKDEAYRSGIISFEDAYNSNIKLSNMQLLQVKTAIHNLPPHIEPYSIHQFLSQLSYPLYHLDFETYQQVVPEWDGVKPYQQIPFQYSIHIQNEPCSEPSHKEFLGKEGEDPRRILAEQLCADIPQGACVLAYNMPFEKGVIKGLARLFPDLAEHLFSINHNMRDLMTPFAKGHYYIRDMGGSFSIKKVLPALCGDDPELDYSKLELVRHGGDVMALYPKLHEQPHDEIKRIRQALLAYCKLDTLAMVKILEKLYQMIG